MSSMYMYVCDVLITQLLYSFKWHAQLLQYKRVMMWFTFSVVYPPLVTRHVTADHLFCHLPTLLWCEGYIRQRKQYVIVICHNM